MDEKRGKEVDLDSLIGEHMLDAVDTSTEKVKTWGDQFEYANCIRFRLDGRVYTAVEDPDDGYRSRMGGFYESEELMRNVFPPCRVLARKSQDQKYQVDDTLELIDVVTGKTVLRVGTDNTDDYYPHFVAEWSPGNMARNQVSAAR